MLSSILSGMHEFYLVVVFFLGMSAVADALMSLMNKCI